MHLTLEKRPTDSIDLGIIYGVIAVLVLVAARYLPVLDIVPSCVFKQLCGIPCPTCGATRSVAYLAGGDLTAAFLMNPAVPLALTAVLVLCLAQTSAGLRGSKLSFSLTVAEAALFRTGTVAAFLANWAFLIYFNR